MLELVREALFAQTMGTHTSLFVQIELHVFLHVPAAHMGPFPLPLTPGQAVKPKRLGTTGLRCMDSKLEKNLVFWFCVV